MKPLFTIITPTYNRGYIIWKTIQSVQKQIYPNWELLIMDDGSTDETEKVVAQFQKDPRIIYKKLNKVGPNKARNYGMEKAKGDFIAYLDSDDYLYENFLSVNLEYFNRYKDAIFTISNSNARLELYDTRHRLIDFVEKISSEKEAFTLSDIYLWKEKAKRCSGTDTLHKRLVIEKGIRWDESLTLFHDVDFKMQLGRYFPQGFLYIPYVLFEYSQRYGGDGICSNATYGEWAAGFELLYQKHKNDPLMQGQTWYPEKVKKYKRMQKEFEEGKIPSPVYKYFPEYGKHKSRS